MHCASLTSAVKRAGLVSWRRHDRDRIYNNQHWRCHTRGSFHSARRSATQAVGLLGAAAPICLDAACGWLEATPDDATFWSLALPYMSAAALGAYLFLGPTQRIRRGDSIVRKGGSSSGGGGAAPPAVATTRRALMGDERAEESSEAAVESSDAAAEEYIVDEAVGVALRPPPGMTPERDADGRLCYKPVAYTPWPLDSAAAATSDAGRGQARLRIDVGPVGRTQPRTFVFSKLLPQPSDVFMVALPRPMGVEFEYDARLKRAVVAGLSLGGPAEQRRRLAKLDAQLVNDCVMEGDVLRGVTALNFVYSRNALLGAKPPQQVVVVYGADKEPWSVTRGALAGGPGGMGQQSREVQQLQVVLVLERRRPSTFNAAAV